MDDAKAIIAASSMKILACDNLDEAAQMVGFCLALLFTHRKTLSLCMLVTHIDYNMAVVWGDS